MSVTAGRAGRSGRAAAVALLLILALAAQAWVQRGFETAWPRRNLEQLLYLPSGRHLKTLTLGFSNLAADVLWIRAIGYFGGHALTDREYPWLYHILDQVTTLDPTFSYPYFFGGIVLAVERESGEESIALLSKGMTRYPGDWRYPFYIGFSAFYHLRDPQRAAVFMRHAASLPGSPEYLPHLAASLLAESGRVDAAIRFLETMAEGTREEWAREKIRLKIRELRSGRVPEKLKEYLAGERAP
jgi:hypothetical protein